MSRGQNAPDPLFVVCELVAPADPAPGKGRLLLLAAGEIRAGSWGDRPGQSITSSTFKHDHLLACKQPESRRDSAPYQPLAWSLNSSFCCVFLPCFQ